MTLYMNSQYFKNEDIPFHIAPYHLTPGTQVASHSHEFVEFVYVAEGKGTHIYNDCAYPIAAGDAFVIEPKAKHAYLIDGSEQIKVFNILFLPEWMESELQALARFTAFIDFYYKEPFMRKATDFQSKLTLKGSIKVSFEHQLQDLASEFEKGEEGWELLCKWKFAELLIAVSRHYKEIVNQAESSDLDDQQTLNKICDFIRTHHTQPLSLEQVFRMCNMSQTTFVTRFKEHTGQTFIEFRNRCRVEVAKTLLVNTSDKILDIAGAVGFEDLSVFNKTFKKYTGISPSNYRKKTK